MAEIELNSGQRREKIKEKKCEGMRKSLERRQGETGRGAAARQRGRRFPKTRPLEFS